MMTEAELARALFQEQTKSRTDASIATGVALSASVDGRVRIKVDGTQVGGDEGVMLDTTRSIAAGQRVIITLYGEPGHGKKGFVSGVVGESGGGGGDEGLEERVTALESSVSSLQSSVSSLSSTVAGHTSSIATLSDQVSTISGQVSSVQQDVSALQSSVSSLSSIVSSHSSTLSSYGTRISSLESTTSSLSTQLSDMSSQVSGISSDLSELSAIVSGIGNALSSLSSTVSSLSTRMSSAESDIDDLQSDMSGLGTRMTTAEGNITSLSGTVAGHTSSISTLQSDVSGLTTRVGDAENDIDDLDTRVTALEQGGGGGGDISALAARVTQCEDDIDDLQTDMTTAQGNISTLQSDVSGLGTRMTSAESDITSLQSTVSGHTSSISTINTNLTTIVNQLNDSTQWGCVDYQTYTYSSNWTRIWYNKASGQVVMVGQANTTLTSGFHYGTALTNSIRPYYRFGTMSSWMTDVIWPTTSNNQGRNMFVNASGQPGFWAGTAGGSRQSGGSISWFVYPDTSYTYTTTIGSSISLTRAMAAAMLMGDRETKGDSYVIENAAAYEQAYTILMGEDAIDPELSSKADAETEKLLSEITTEASESR